MDLYSHCLLVITKNEDIDFECVPHTVKEDIKQLKVMYQKMTDHRDAYHALQSIYEEIGETAWETLTCNDCDHTLPWPDLIGRCEFHEITMEWLYTEEKERKIKANITAVRYHSERDSIEDNFPHLLCVLKKLEEQLDIGEE